MKVRATLLEIYHRIIGINEDKEGKVYWNGEDNLYPYEIEGVITNSPTASRAAKVFGKYISGSGLTNEAQDVIVNERKNYKLSNIASIVGRNYSTQGGAWIHVGYKMTDDLLSAVQGSLDVLDYPKCRFEKEDDEGNKGRIIYKDFKEKKNWLGFKKQKTHWFYPYNPNPDIVIAQIKADYSEKNETADVDSLPLSEMIVEYRGQVYYDNLTPEYKYALSPFDCVYNDCDTEYRIGLYTNEQWRGGMLGKVMVVTQSLDDEEADKIDNDIKGWLGAGNSSGIYHLSVSATDDINNVVKVEQVKPLFDEKLFTQTKKDLRTNILGAANNLPEALILSADGSLFGTSGDTYEQMKLFYSEQTHDERWHLSETLTYLGFPCEIKPIITLEDEINSGGL